MWPMSPVCSHPSSSIVFFVAEKVASYKQVRRLTFVDAIPKSASGKILRRMLRDQPAG